MSSPNGICPPDDTDRAQFQRPDLSIDDPRGGFKHNPEFRIMGSFDNGTTWSSTQGNLSNRFVNC
jgi:hypothetical protein